MAKANVKGKTTRTSNKRNATPSKKNAGQENSPKPTQEITEENNQTSEPTKVDIKELVQTTFASLAPEASQDLEKKRDEILKRYLQENIQSQEIAKQYNILILHDELRMVKSDADHIYAAARGFSEKKPLLLILHSTGGHVGSAYLIGKLCREYSGDKLVVVVPRRAKSAATLVCCAADEIHMGSLSELGPIDPQIDNLPALGLKSSVQHIAELVSEHPNAADMFAKYLHYAVQPIHLGYYERVAESAAQYAERLLKSHMHSLKGDPGRLAKDLVYTYKDHGFVIDYEEALELFGDKIVKKNTKEYDLSNLIYGVMDFFSNMADVAKHNFYFIGSIFSDPHFLKRSNG